MTRMLRSAAPLLCLALCLTSCGGTPQVVKTTELRVVTPPASLTTAVPEPLCEPAVWADMVSCWVETLDALRLANIRLRALGEWSATAGGTP